MAHIQEVNKYPMKTSRDLQEASLASVSNLMSGEVKTSLEDTWITIKTESPPYLEPIIHVAV